MTWTCAHWARFRANRCKCPQRSWARAAQHTSYQTAFPTCFCASCAWTRGKLYCIFEINGPAESQLMQHWGLETLGGELDSASAHVGEAWAASSCLALPGLGEGGPEEGGKGGHVGGEPVVGCLERRQGPRRRGTPDRPAGGPSSREPKQRAIETDSEGGSSWATLGVRDSAK